MALLLLILTSCGARQPITPFTEREGVGWKARIYSDGKISLLAVDDNTEYLAAQELCKGFICVGPTPIGLASEIERIKLK